MPPVLDTPRLRLRLPGTTGDLEGDIDAMWNICRDVEVMRFITGRGMTRDEISSALRRSEIYFARTKMGGFLVEEKSSGAIVGDCLLVPIPHVGVDPANADARGPETEVGYRLARSAWGKGYATEAATAALAYAFDDAGGACDIVLGVTHPENAASQHVLRKLGLHDEGISTQYYFGNSRLFSITKAQWAARGVNA